MSSNRLYSYTLSLISALSLLTVPAMTMAQESVDESGTSAIEATDDAYLENHVYTAKDNFGGWKIGIDVLFGANWYIKDDDDIGGTDLRRYDHDNTDNAIINGTLQLQLSYLWGNDVFYGLVLNAMTGYPVLFAADIRFKLLIPLGQHKKDAVSLSTGWGATIAAFRGGEEYVQVIPDSDYPVTNVAHEIYRLMYFPIELSYEHVFDSRFILGASIQFMISNTSRNYFTREPNTTDENFLYNVQIANGKLYVPNISNFVAGVHLGYKF